MTKTPVLAALALAAGCSSSAGFDLANGSGGSGADCGNTQAVACTWAGVIGTYGFTTTSAPNGDGYPIAKSPLDFPIDLTFGPDGKAYVLDWNNHRVRVVGPAGTFQTLIGNDMEGDGPENPADESPYDTTAGCAPESVSLNHPTDVRFMPDGTLVLAAWHDNKIRVVDPTTGLEKVLAGGTYGYAGDNGPAWGALFNQPKSLAIDPEGRIYTNDQRNERIRMIDIDAQRTITTIAGKPSVDATTTYTIPAYGGDGGPAIDAQFGWDSGGTPDPSGALLLMGRQLYIADSLNNRIRVMDLDAGTISCFAGPACTHDVTLSYPADLELGPDGRMYIAERDGNVVDALDLSSGVLTPIVGNSKACASSRGCIETTKSTPALEVQLNKPYGVAFDPTGNLYVADYYNHRLVRVVM